MVALLQKEFGGLPCQEGTEDVLVAFEKLGLDGADPRIVAILKQQIQTDVNFYRHPTGPVDEATALELAKKLGLA